jgi:hypothetical protein
MSDKKRPVESDADVEAQLLKESLGAGLAAAAIFAGTTQADSYPVPSPPGTADAAAEVALIPTRSPVKRAVQQTAPKAAKKIVKAKKVSKAQKSSFRGAGGGGRSQPA